MSQVGSMSPEQLQNYQNMAAELSQGMFWKPKEGANRIRILPSRDLVNHPDIMERVAVHFKVGPTRKTTNCNKLQGSKCAICDYIEGLQSSGQTPPEDIEPQTLFDFSILDLNVFDQNASEYLAKTWSASSYQTQQIVGHLIDPDWGDVTHPELGRSCTVTKTNKNGRISYDIKFSPKASPVDITRVKYPASRKFDTYEQQQAILQGVDVAQAPAPIATTPAVSSPAPPPAQPVTATPVAAPPPVSKPVQAPVPPAAPVAPVVESVEWYYINNNKESVGPMTKTELLEHCDKLALIWGPSLQGWTELGKASL